MSVNIGSRFHLSLSVARLVVVVSLVVLLVLCIWIGSQHAVGADGSPIQDGWQQGVESIGVNVVFLALGLALAPSPRPQDFSGVAVVAVNAVAERARATATLIENLDSVLGSPELEDAPLVKLRLVMVQEELQRQRGSLVQDVALWARVSPGSEDEIVKNRQTGTAVLQKLEKELDGE